MNKKESTKLIHHLSTAIVQQKNDLKQKESQLVQQVNQLMNDMCELKCDTDKTKVHNIHLNEILEQMNTKLATYTPHTAKEIVSNFDWNELLRKLQQIKRILAICDSEILKRLKNANLCRICKKRYDKQQTSERNPILLVPCGHCICKDCVLNDLDLDLIRCPWCDVEITDTIVLQE